MSYPLSYLRMISLMLPKSEILINYMLIDEQDPNILPLHGESLKGLLDSCVIRLAIHNEKVLLRVRRRRNVLYSVSSASSSKRARQEPRSCVPRCQPRADQLLSPGGGVYWLA